MNTGSSVPPPNSNDNDPYEKDVDIELRTDDNPSYKAKASGDSEQLDLNNLQHKIGNLEKELNSKWWVKPTVLLPILLVISGLGLTIYLWNLNRIHSHIDRNSNRVDEIYRFLLPKYPNL